MWSWRQRLRATGGQKKCVMAQNFSLHVLHVICWGVHQLYCIFKIIIIIIIIISYTLPHCTWSLLHVVTVIFSRVFFIVKFTHHFVCETCIAGPCFSSNHPLSWHWQSSGFQKWSIINVFLPGLKIIFGRWSVMLAGQRNFSLVTSRFWPVKIINIEKRN